MAVFLYYVTAVVVVDIYDS